MLLPGPALKVTVYLNQDTGSNSGFLHDDVLTFLRESKVQGATALRAHSGFGVHRQIHRSGAGQVAGEHLPVVISFIDTRTKVESLLPELLSMVTDGLIEAHSTEVLKNIVTAEKVLS